MDKLTLTKAIETLKNTECSAKEKIHKFDQINESLTALTHHSNYKQYLQSSIQILLLFCEDNDSNVRISAEENLNRIIRMVEKQHQIVLVQIELYHEIKKNGNERSLKICLNLFSHYAQNIKHRRRKVYGQNLIPSMLAIAKRSEGLVIEAFVDFIKSFSKCLLNCLSEHEVAKLIDAFMDNLAVECAIKRRCSAQNICTIIESLFNKKIIKSVIDRIQLNLAKDKVANLIIGTLNLLRLLLHQLIELKEHHAKVIELLETCLNYLKNEPNHSIVNANLEVINELLAEAANNKEIKSLLIDNEKHKEILLSRHQSAVLLSCGSRKSSVETLKQQENLLQLPQTSLLSTPNRSLCDFSDVEGDSFKSTDFDADVQSSSPGAFKNVIGTAENMSLKSADSINSFFTSILTHSNTDTVTKFFRKSSTESPSHQHKSEQSGDDKSIDLTLSHLRDNSIECTDSQALPETAELALEDDETLEIIDDTSISIASKDAPQKLIELYIGTIYDQCIVDYIVRLVASKFLLDGVPKTLIGDHIVRVSIKNLALSVIAGCVELKWNVLLMKLSKDFTSESMMVENLLSYLIDEDLRLEEEDKKRKNIAEEEGEGSKMNENFLEIKDDHFGECTTAAFLDYFSPLSKTIDDHGLISLKNRIYEEKMAKDRDANVKKINQDLCKLLSSTKSDISEKLPLMETNLKMPDDKDSQFIADVLIFSSHGDPVLRANIYTIIGNFLRNILERNLDYEKIIAKQEFVRDLLEFNHLIKLLRNGLHDEFHSVVKQTLSVFENCINLVIPFMSNDDDVTQMINDILMVSYNKYWLVQIKCCDVITKIDLSLIEKKDHAEVYEIQILQQLFSMIKDNDFRVRNYASESISKLILKESKSEEILPLLSFAFENIFHNEIIKIIPNNNAEKVERELSKIIYTLTNSLMELKEKNQQFGIIYAVKILIRKFSPNNYPNVWKEFNIFNILTSYINRNANIALDISCHCNMLEIISSLLPLHSENKENSDFLNHLLKIINIYRHVVNNTKPLMVAKGKSDLFTSSKELALINSFGFFTNEHFYLKLYLVLKNSYDSYRMTINKEAEVKLKELLHLTLNSLQVILELKSACKDDVKLIEEIVGYLNELMSFQPDDCIITAKILLKFLFRENFAWNKFKLENIKEAIRSEDHTAVFEYVSNSSSTQIEMIFEDSLIKSFDGIVIQSLRLFSKSPAKLQTIILDLLCQLLEFNINYMQLDAKKIFVDFVLRQLEYIEDGLVIDSEILTPKIFEFLIYLTKLKDKKLLTMPKIINLIDVQLAATNKHAKECGIQALLILVKEVYFKTQQLPSTTDEMILAEHTKDLNALKEVTLSMMIKFIHHKDVQQHLEWILLKSKENVDENDLYVGLLNAESPDYQLIKSLSKNILLESKNFKLVIEKYWRMLEKCDIKDVRKLSFLQQNVLMMSEEVYLVNHIKLVHQKQNMSGNALSKFLENHYQFFKKLLLEKTEIFEFLSFLKFENFPSLADDFKSILNVKEIIEASCHDSIEYVLKYLLTMEKSLEEIESVITACNHQDYPLNHHKLLNSLHKNLFEVRGDINTWESDEIMNFFKSASKTKILLKYCQNTLMKSLLEDVEISRIIIRKLTKIPLQLSKVKFILENSHNACLVDILLFLISIESKEEVKILQLVMVKKLHSNKEKLQFGDLMKLKEKLSEYEVQQKFLAIGNAISLLLKAENYQLSIDYKEMSKTIDENWLLEQTGDIMNENSSQIAEILFEIKSELKLQQLLSSKNFNIKLLSSTINTSFEKMLKTFKIDCISINPHLNYMKISPLLKISSNVLLRELENEKNDTFEMVKILTVYLNWILRMKKTAMIYVEIRLIDKFINEKLLKNFDQVIRNFYQRIVEKLEDGNKIELILDCIYALFLITPEFISEWNNLIHWIFKTLQKLFKFSDFVARYQTPQLFDEINDIKNSEVTKEVVFIAKILEIYEDGELQFIPLTVKEKKIIEISFKISQFLLRQKQFYQFSITPYEVIVNYRHGDNMLNVENFNLKQIPIEYLNDSDLLERYIRRINRYGFTQRKDFEEIFMTLLVLLNQWNDNLHDPEELFCVKNLCLQMNVDLLLSCFRYGNFENDGECNVAHLPRSEKWAKMELIGIKKLHHIQEILCSSLNVFYQPNLERIDVLHNSNAISTKNYGMNQLSLSYTWHLTNEASKSDHILRNMTYVNVEKLEIDYKSALQLIYDLMTQMIDENPVIVLPQLAKLIDILDNTEQFKWINKKMQNLYEAICSEDTISHQYIVYLMCRSSAVIVLSLSELQQIIAIINKYLGCNHMFVRNATLHGLLCLCESLIKTNTAIGTISDELKLLRTTIVNYTSKNGIVYENITTSTTSQHDKLVWTLNFYILENTLKFGDCNDLLIDTLISANNVLKRTNDVNLFHLIVNGLERLIIIDHDNRLYRDKIEKLALDLMKIENKNFSFGGLKLLVSCMYMGSLEQLENTEMSNGIVQDEPEIVMHSTEKIEILFNRIRTATSDEAEVYGRVLGQILKDLLPPNEILTKIIKELLILNQSNVIVIAKIIHQVFRTAIDSSHLQLLQEWLICSLSNFLTYPNQRKSIWFLSLIFMSSTLNLHLLKLFPTLLDENCTDARLYKIFIVSAKDFFDRLSNKQQIAFRECFRSKLVSPSSPTTTISNHDLFQDLMKHL